MAGSSSVKLTVLPLTLSEIDDVPVVIKGYSIKHFDRCEERIPHSALGQDELRLRGIVLDLATQAKHLNVNGPVVDFVVVDTACFQQLIPGEHPLRRSQQ